MSTAISALAGLLPQAGTLVDIPRLLADYFDLVPDASLAPQRVAFGTSGHRGVASERSFNEAHVLAITQAICEFRKRNGSAGPLFLGIDTHALSLPAMETALEVLAANSVVTMIARSGEYTPTPALSHAILAYNRGRSFAFADGIVMTPSHNPPDYGGLKYNLAHGGPADSVATAWIQTRANQLLEGGLVGLRRVPFAQARLCDTTREHDYIGSYVADLDQVLDFDVIRGADIRMGVDPLGGAGIHYWPRIAERYGVFLNLVGDEIDPAFGFMSLDWDGRIRMDPSSPWTMQRLLAVKDRYDIAFACDPDHDRHGIVTRDAGIMAPNHYICVAIDYLFRHRPLWSAQAAVGKTVVSSALIDRVVARLGRELFDAPVGFKWFVDGLHNATLAFAGEESAGASCSRRDGSVWTTDKDGIVLALLSAEITARSGRQLDELYRELARDLGDPVADRIEAPATAEQKAVLAKLSPQQLPSSELAGEKIEQKLDSAPGNGAALGGVKIIAASGWFAARPSGTEDIYKIYAESFLGVTHLQQILREAQVMVDTALASVEIA
jgi:phosphoglucomutase